MTGAKLTAKEFKALRVWIQDTCGIALGDEKEYFIQSHIGRLLADAGCSSFGQLYTRLRSNREPGLVSQIVESITTRETMWFRDRGPWVLLDAIFWPKLIRLLTNSPTAQVRIWSAASSTGQEAYSIAMSFLQACASRGADVRISQRFEVLGSDISGKAVDVARRGVYDAMSVRRGLSDLLRARYFDNTSEGWAIKSTVRDHVHFMELNLMHDLSTLGRFDIIFCRNILIYFAQPTKQGIVSRISEHLKDDGALLLGSAESLQDVITVLACKDHMAHYYYAPKPHLKSAQPAGRRPAST